MKKIFLAMSLLVAGAVTSQAQAHMAAPLWGCKLKASNIRTQSQVELLLIRGETATAQGLVVCRDAIGQRVTQKVDILLTSGGVGPAFNGPLEGLRLYAVRAGVATPDGMIGTYQLSAGPRFGLLGARVGVMGGVQVSGSGVGAGIEAVIENRFSIGIDLGGMAMEVRPARASRK